jgi:hypothetical protein
MARMASNTMHMSANVTSTRHTSRLFAPTRYNPLTTAVVVATYATTKIIRANTLYSCNRMYTAKKHTTREDNMAMAYVIRNTLNGTCFLARIETGKLLALLSTAEGTCTVEKTATKVMVTIRIATKEAFFAYLSCGIKLILFFALCSDLKHVSCNRKL